MLLVAMIELPDTPEGTDMDLPDSVAQGVLARVADEAGYSEDGNPYGPGAVTVYALTGIGEAAARNRVALALDAAVELGGAAARKLGDGATT